MNDNSALGVGLGMSALGAAATYHNSKMNKNTLKFMMGNTRAAINNLDKNQLLDDTFKKEQKAALYKQAENIVETKNLYKKNKIYLKQGVVLGTVLVACGAIVNAANNHQRATSANNATTDTGNEYTKVNMGKKLGAILGAVAAVGIMAANKAIMKPFNKIQKENLKNLEEFAGKDIAKLLKKSGHLAMALTVAANAVGGLALGAIADKISNHKAAKAADKAVA